MKIGLVGYGVGGRYFHAPFMMAAEGVELVGIVARAEKTIATIRQDFPDMPIYSSLDEMIAAGVCEAVTITTPPQTRRELVLQAIEAGLHVIADKPFAPDAAAGRELEQAARDRGVILGVFHNRRFDADLQTLKQVIESDAVGKVWRIHSRMDQNSVDTIERGESGGLLRDLGSHVVDQMLYLLGPAKSVNAQLDHYDFPEGRTVVSFYLVIQHLNGANSYLSASKMNFIDQRELRVYGEKGSYSSLTTDIQAQSIFAGKRPVDDLESWGYEPEANWGILRTAEGESIVPSVQGRYHDYYEGFAHAVRDGGEPPATPDQAIQAIAVLDAAYISAQTGQVVELA